MNYLSAGPGLGSATANPQAEDLAKKKKIEEQVKQALASQPLPLADGSGQQVGTLDQNTNKELTSEIGQQKELLDRAVQKKKAFQELAKAKQQIVQEKDDDEFMDDASYENEQEPKVEKEDESSEDSSNEDTDTKDKKEKKQFKLSDSDDPNEAGLENLMNMSEVTDNPMAQGAAVLIGGLQADEKRKQKNKDLDKEKGEAAGRHGTERAKLLMQLAGSFKGMLS